MKHRVGQYIRFTRKGLSGVSAIAEISSYDGDYVWLKMLDFDLRGYRMLKLNEIKIEALSKKDIFELRLKGIIR